MASDSTTSAYLPTEGEHLSDVAVIIFSTLYTVVAILALFGNTLNVVAIASSKVMRRNLSNLFILNLSVSDLLVVPAIFPPPTLYDRWFAGRGGSLRASIVITSSLQMLSVFGTIASVFIIAMDRYLAVLKPHKYKIILTLHRAYVILGVTWMVLLTGLCHLLYVGFTTDEEQFILNSTNHFMWMPNYIGYILFACFASLGFVCVIFLYGCIAYTVVRQRKIISQAAHNASGGRASLASEKQSYIDSKTCKSLKIMAAIVLNLFICCLPSLVFCISVGPHKDSTTMTIHYCLFLMLSSNAWLDPLIYAWQSREMQKAHQKLLGLFKIGGKRKMSIRKVAPSDTTKSTVSFQVSMD